MTKPYVITLKDLIDETKNQISFGPLWTLKVEEIAQNVCNPYPLQYYGFPELSKENGKWPEKAILKVVENTILKKILPKDQHIWIAAQCSSLAQLNGNIGRLVQWALWDMRTPLITDNLVRRTRKILVDDYGMNIEKDVPRCPNCSKELRSETDIICINCGFNNRTRSLNRVVRVQYKGTWDYALWHALPVLYTFIIIGTIVLLVLYYLRWYQWALDNRQESVLAWLLCNQVSQIYIWVAALSVFWKCGKPAFMRFFVHPHPPEEEVLGK